MPTALPATQSDQLPTLSRSDPGSPATATPAPIPETATEPAPSATFVPTPTPPLTRLTEDNLPEIAAIHLLEGHTGRVSEVTFSPDSSIVASSSADGTLRLWQARDGELLHVLEGHEEAVRSLSFSPDGTLIASGSDDQTVRIWRVGDGSLVRSIDTALAGRALEVAFSPDGSLIAIAGHLCHIALRRTSDGMIRRTLQQPRCVPRQGGVVDSWGLGFSPEGIYLATGEGRPGGGGSIQLWDYEAYTPPQLVEGYDLVVRDLAFSPDGSTLAVALVGSSQIWLLQVEGGAVLERLEGHTYRVNAVGYAPDGGLLASAGRDRVIRLWDPATGDRLHTLEGHTDAVNTVSFSPDGRLIASGSDDNQVIIWGIQPP